MPYNTAPIAPRKEVTGQAQLPLARVKKIIAQDSDIAMCSNNAAFVITLATEMFIQYLAEQGHNVVKSEKKPRRNIQYRDLANAVARHDVLEFLSDIVPRTLPFKEVKARAKANGNSLPRHIVEPGQTTLDGKTPLANGNGIGTHGLGLDGSADEAFDDESGTADPSMQLEIEIRGMREGTGPTEELNGDGDRDEDDMEKFVKEDVEMS